MTWLRFHRRRRRDFKKEPTPLWEGLPPKPPPTPPPTTTTPPPTPMKKRRRPRRPSWKACNLEQTEDAIEDDRAAEDALIAREAAAALSHQLLLTLMYYYGSKSFISTKWFVISRGIIETNFKPPWVSTDWMRPPVFGIRMTRLFRIRKMNPSSIERLENIDRAFCLLQWIVSPFCMPKSLPHSFWRLKRTRSTSM